MQDTKDTIAEDPALRAFREEYADGYRVTADGVLLSAECLEFLTAGGDIPFDGVEVRTVGYRTEPIEPAAVIGQAHKMAERVKLTPESLDIAMVPAALKTEFLKIAHGIEAAVYGPEMAGPAPQMKAVLHSMREDLEASLRGVAPGSRLRMH